MQKRKGISSFSVLLLMAVTAIVGLACFSMLKVQYTPSAGGNTIRINYYYPGASARTVEAEVTSRLEGALSNIRSCSGLSSVSYSGSGSISLDVERRGDIAAARFEAASVIRNIYSSLPDGCSYPSISINARGEKSQTAIAFNISSSLPSKEIADIVNKTMMHPLSLIEGVSDVSFYGQTPYEWVITFDADKAASSSINAEEIKRAFVSFYSEDLIGMTRSGDKTFGVKLRNDTAAGFEGIPVKEVDGRIIRLGEIATFRYQEALPSSYFRINGLNVLNLTVEVSSDANLVSVVKAVKEKVASLKGSLPQEISISVGYDYSDYISKELSKIYFRTLLCLLILLLFVFAFNRSWRYMTMIAITLAVDLLISIAIYYLCGLHIHIYTLAGVTVSLGIIIDNSIVMIDHYSRYRTRSVFPALLTAVLTTVAALLVILLLPEEEKANLTDFSLVIIINLAVSLLVSYLFVPALLDYFPIDYDRVSGDSRKLRKVVRWNTWYQRYIQWGLRHGWVFVLSLILAFGIPTCLLPTRVESDGGKPLDKGQKVLAEIVGWKPYADNKAKIDKAVGSSFGLFYRAMSRSDFYREPERQTLNIRAGMPEGCTVGQLDEVMRSMENYLAGINEIDVFETNIRSYDDGQISVLFKPQYEGTSLPSRIKGEVIAMAANFGGANWSVSGIDDNYFNNNIVTDYKNYSVTLKGYNYDELISFGEQLLKHLSTNRRVSGAEIWGSGYRDRPMTEFNLRYDLEALAALGISPYEYYSALQSPLFDETMMKLQEKGGFVQIRLESSSKEDFDIWHVDNSAVNVGDGKMKLSEVGSVSKDKTGLPIQKEDQSYCISVRFNFIGSYQLAEQVTEDAVDYMNSEVLPIGFNASGNQTGWFYGHKEKYAWLILLVIAIIFVLCAIHFNSLRYPLAVILMIPISFIGLFLAFGLSDFTFDKGGFAAFVMLSGITVNAGIYLISAWLHDPAVPVSSCEGRSTSLEGSVESAAQIAPAGRQTQSATKTYTRAFNRKIWPITLTVVSTILGLVPFLFDGPDEVFWFSFAIGTIAGMLFSIIALVFVLPVFALRRKSS